MGLKEQLAARGLPTVTFPLRVGNDTVARKELAAAQLSGDENRIVAARTAVAQCYEDLTLTALPPVKMEELIKAHPPTDAQHAEAQQAGHKVMFNADTFVPAILAACVDSDIDEATWIEYASLGPLSPGEINALFLAVWGLNQRIPDPAVPKD